MTDLGDLQHLLPIHFCNPRFHSSNSQQQSAMPIVDPNVLKEARKESGMSQAQLAKNLDISQTQVSRYEKNPDSIPAGLFSRWTSLFGLSPADVLQKTSGNSLRVNPGEPYLELDRDLDLLERYIETQAPRSFDTLSNDEEKVGGKVPSVEDLKARINDFRRKPNVMMAGGFDTGKSYLANTLMGKEVLPTSYTPATRVITVVRHVEDRPDWQDEDVWLLDDGLWSNDDAKEDNDQGGERPVLDIARLNDQEKCGGAKVLAGSHDLLGKYGVHRSEPTEEVKKKMEEAHSAVVYVDSPFLKACNVVDLPGFGDLPVSKSSDPKSADQKKAESVLPFADVVLYASRAQGHLSGKDLARISALFQLLPKPGAGEENHSFPTLGNLFLVATHADRNISDDEIEKIKKRSTSRLHEHLKNGALLKYENQTGHSVTVGDLRAQWFPFWAENEERSRGLVDRIEEVIGEKLPEVSIRKARKDLQNLKENVQARCDSGAMLYQEAAEESVRQQEKVKKLKEKSDERMKTLRQKREEVHALIDKQEQKGKNWAETIVRNALDEEDIAHMIGNSFRDKNRAKNQAPARVVEYIESRLERKIDDLNDEIVDKVDEYLDAFEEFSVGADGNEGVEIPFDVQGAFAGGLASVGTAGALAAWASQLGSLGGYVIVSQGVGALSALGVSISGGAAAASAWVAAMGGPVALGAAVAGVAGLASWRLLTKSWEERLAKKIVKYYRDEGLEENFVSGVEKYWEQTRKAFEAGAEAAENEFESQLNQLEKLDKNEKEARRQADRFEEARDFYAGLPV